MNVPPTVFRAAPTARTLRAAYHCDQAITLGKLPWVEAGHPAEHTFTQP